MPVCNYGRANPILSLEEGAMNKWFVEPNTVRLELSDGEWVEVKEELTYGEQQRLSNAAMTRFQDASAPTPRIELDFERYQIIRLKTWLTDWSAKGHDGKSIKITDESIRALRSDMAAEIDAALTAHIESLEAAKNAPTPPTEKSE